MNEGTETRKTTGRWGYRKWWSEREQAEPSELREAKSQWREQYPGKYWMMIMIASIYMTFPICQTLHLLPHLISTSAS